jgi:hypothetical protein
MTPLLKTVMIVSIASGVVVIALTTGLAVGLKNTPSKHNGDSEKDHVVLNSYDNTEELIKKYKVLNPTTVNEGLEKKIQNRLLTGFENWNRGFNTWKEWGNILYIPESIYNVHGARLSLASYQAAMDISLQQANILMGDFHNMLITDKYCGIHYDFISNGKKSRVMEFVEFSENAENGAYVKEGWGSTKDVSYYGLINFQADAQKTEEAAITNELLSLQIPTTDNLKVKYPIKYPTVYTDEEEKKLEIILEGFDSWNNGIEAYKAWVDKAYDKNAKSSGLDGKERTMEQYKEEMEKLCNEKTITKLRFDHVFIREDWAAIHYRYRYEGENYVGDRMQFLKFQERGGALKIIASWVQ